MIISLKFYQFSRNHPVDLPPNFVIHSAATNFPMFQSHSLIKSNMDSMTPSAPPPIHIFFGSSYGQVHRLLPITTIRSHAEESRELIFGTKPASSRLCPQPLSSRRPSSDITIRKLLSAKAETSRQPLLFKSIQKIWYICRGGAAEILIRQILNSVSSFIKKILPSNVNRILMIATHGNSNDLAGLLLFDSAPLNRIGPEVHFTETGSSETCQIKDCVCKKGLLVNRWIYETFFNERNGDSVSRKLNESS